MRALFVNPWVYDFKCYDFWIKPLGLLKIAALLKKSGIETHLVDCMDRFAPGLAEGFKKEDQFGRGEYYSEELNKPDAYLKIRRKYKRYGFPVELFKKKLSSLENQDIIFVDSNMTYSYEGVHLAINLLKEKFSTSKIILGGIYATLSYNHAVSKSGADIVWKGDITPQFTAQLKQLTRGAVERFSEEEIKEIAPDYSFYGYTPYAAVKFTNGCPFSCTYCAVKSFCEGFYQRKPEGIFKELEYYHSRKIKTIAFYDDALLYKNHFIKSILKEVIKREYKFSFMTPNGLHASYIDAELAGLMKEAGFSDLRVSLETSDYAMQKKTGGKVNSGQFTEAVKNLKEAGFEGKDIGVYILAGMPGQTVETVMKDVEFLKKYGVKIKLANYSPIPGTVEFLRLKPAAQAELAAEPLKQNEHYFIRINPDYDNEMNEEVKKQISAHNSSL